MTKLLLFLLFGFLTVQTSHAFFICDLYDNGKVVLSLPYETNKDIKENYKNFKFRISGHEANDPQHWTLKPRIYIEVKSIEGKDILAAELPAPSFTVNNGAVSYDNVRLWLDLSKLYISCDAFPNPHRQQI